MRYAIPAAWYLLIGSADKLAKETPMQTFSWQNTVQLEVRHGEACTSRFGLKWIFPGSSNFSLVWSWNDTFDIYPVRNRYMDIDLRTMLSDVLSHYSSYLISFYLTFFKNIFKINMWLIRDSENPSIQIWLFNVYVV